MILGQNTEGYVDFCFCDENDEVLDTSAFVKIEFTFDVKGKHQIIKYWPQDTSIVFDATKNVFSVWLTQAETQHWTNQVPVQARIQYSDGTIDSTDIDYWNMRACLSHEVMVNDKT